MKGFPTTYQRVAMSSIADLGSSKYKREAEELRQIRKRAKRLKRSRGKTDAERIAELEDRVRSLGNLADACTYDVLREVCEGCRCKRSAARATDSP